MIAGTSLFAAASDEDCVLRVYDAANPGTPVATIDVTQFLEPDDPTETEADIEGAAQIGDRIYWIGSHGRSRKGKERKIRQRLFATTLSHAGGTVQLRTTGLPFKTLLHAIVTAPDLAGFDLATAATKTPEEVGGLNIEGLAPTLEGDLLIGFRNPLPGGTALIARLRNPSQLVAGISPVPEISLAATLDLGGRGVRALEFIEPLGLYLVLAGAFDDQDDFRLFRWSGDRGAPAEPLIAEFGDLHPEELIVLSHSKTVLSVRLLSDDGTDACKKAAVDQRSFRSGVVSVNL
jgi:hypothetical protein